MAIPFSERQAKTIATAITIVAVIVILFALATIVWLTASFLRAYATVFLPIAVGGIESLAVRRGLKEFHHAGPAFLDEGDRLLPPNRGLGSELH